MLDLELVDAIREKVGELPEVEELSPAAAGQVIDDVAGRYVFDRQQTWWWTSLKGKHKCIRYGQDDGLAYLGRIVPSKSIAFLVVTDDEAPPWPVFRGTVEDLLSILQDLRFCEYSMVERDGNWIAFDTHDNSLILGGDLA
jgi:hypothetical protein